MRGHCETLCETLFQQAVKLSEEAQIKKIELLPNEQRAIKRITRIYSAVNADDNKVVELLEASEALREAAIELRSGMWDKDGVLYERLVHHTRSKLEIISPESLKGYVGLID